MDKLLTATKTFEVRFSEVDSMNIVWHGAYPLYFEDAREEFGKKYGLSYSEIFSNGYFAPLVDINFKYKKPILYGMRPEIQIIYRPTQSAKIIFDYVVTNPEDNSVLATGSSTQVFMDRDYQLVWYSPDFYLQWKNKWGV